MQEEKNGIDIPAHLNEEFFKKALEKGLNQENLNVQNLNFTLGSSPGENFCSVIYRVQVDYTDNNGSSHRISIIVKSLTEGLAILEELKVFERERDVYEIILPTMTTIINGNALAPNCYYSQKEPVSTIVFDDLNSLGYFNADRVQGLDEDHCALVFQKLGIFHGLSMEMAQKDRTLISKFDNAFDNRDLLNASFFKNGVVDNIKFLVEVTAKWTGFEKISEKLKKLCDNSCDLVDKCYFALSTRSREIQVLTHNDLWTNNILFKYANDSKKLVDLIFVDFQRSSYTSPGFDITHFLYTSPYIELLENKRDFMLKEYYYKSLVSTLKQRNYSPIPSFDEILQEIENREFSGFLMAVSKLPVISTPKELIPDNSKEDLPKEDVKRKIREIRFSTERFQSIMKYILKRLDSTGHFD